MISISRLYRCVEELESKGASSFSVCVSEQLLHFWYHEDPTNVIVNPKGDSLGFVKNYPVIRIDGKVGLIKCIMGGGIHYEHIHEEHWGTNKTMR
jgi:hypothetical protein